LPNAAFGQEFNPLVFSFNSLSNNVDKKPVLLNTSLSVMIPICRVDDFIGVAGVNFRHNSFNMPGDSLNIHSSYTISLPLSGIVKLPGGRVLATSIDLGLSSDMRHINMDDFRFQGSVLYGKPVNKTLTCQVGIGIAKRSSDYLIWPLFLFNVPFSNKLSLSGSFPIKQKLTYKLNDQQAVGLATGVDVNSFRFSGADKRLNANAQQLKMGVFYLQKIALHVFMNCSVEYKSLKMNVFENQINSTLSLPFEFNNSKNAIENLKSQGVSLQISFYYSLF
jgi:hypothetical protein